MTRRSRRWWTWGLLPVVLGGCASSHEEGLTAGRLWDIFIFIGAVAAGILLANWLLDYKDDNIR